MNSVWRYVLLTVVRCDSTSLANFMNHARMSKDLILETNQHPAQTSNIDKSIDRLLLRLFPYLLRDWWLTA